MLTETKMCLAAGDQNLDCRRIKNTDFLNPKLEDDTKGRKLLQLQEDHKVNWKEYTIKEVVDSVVVKSIVAAADV